MSTDSQANNKRIAKNTIFLYGRMLFLMILSLFTSRVVLATLGVNDYGLYNVVGGIVLFLGFLNSALSNGTSRFITYEMGKGENGKLNAVFQNSFIVHCILALIIFFIAETVGLWFLYNRLGVPEDRLNAAIYVYQFSILTTILNITQVPYSSLIISHEKMDIYAYTTVVEGVLKLLIVYVLTISDNWDKLVVYGLLLCIIQIGLLSFYRCYCIRMYNESSLKNIVFNKKLSKDILSFSGWSLIGNLAHTLNAQGMNIITNMFFGPAVVAARALSTTVNGAVMSLSNNFRIAANPQIIKLYSAGEITESKKLMLSTTRYSFYLMLVFAVPLIFSCREVLDIWLEEVPEWTDIFVQLIMVQSLFFTFDTCFYTGLYACGKVKENSLISPTLYFLQFFIVYILFKVGFNPLTLSVAGVITSAIAAFIVKPLLLNRFAQYNFKEIYGSIGRCICVMIMASIIPLVLYLQPYEGWLFFIGKVFISVLSSIIFILFIGFSKKEKIIITQFIKSKIQI